MISLTSELTMRPKAAPMMMPTAISNMLPRNANSRNSPNNGPPRLPNSAFGLPRCVNPAFCKTGSLLDIMRLLCWWMLPVASRYVKRQKGTSLAAVGGARSVMNAD